MANAEEVGPLVHRQREQPANLLDQRSISFLLEGRPLTYCF
jgi:hypothetical protein